MVVRAADMCELRGPLVRCLSVAGVVDAFGKFLGLGCKGLEARRLVDGDLAGFVEHGVHQGGTDDDAICIGADTRPCSAVETPMPTHTFFAPASRVRATNS